MKGAHPAASSRPPCRPLRLAALLAGTAVLGLSGCASNSSGIGGSPTYACKAPTGAQCTSVSGVYANAGQGARQLLSSDTLRTGGSGALGTPAADAAPHRPVVRSGAVEPASSATAIEPRPTNTNPHAAAAGTAPAVSPAALRTAPRVLRLWIAPWEDSDGDLHEASTVHVLIDHGRWLIERVRPAPRGPRMGVTPPAAVGTSPAGTPPGGQAQGIRPRANPSLDQPEP
ncbi:type IV conjugative transfer system lipoprotein TraV [Roseateles sp.]|uniref:type IV conjugative transfer system lipoprotein TraV n=1 Tax=Roseateles sp. TaxID=1971397 RepID=UPI003BA71691